MIWNEHSPASRLDTSVFPWVFLYGVYVCRPVPLLLVGCQAQVLTTLLPLVG